MRCPCAFLDRRLAQNGCRAWLASEGLLLPAHVTGAGHRTFFHPLGRRGTFCTLLKRWQAWVKITSTLGSHVSCPAQNLVKFDDVLIGSKFSFCETVVIFDLVHDDDLAKQALFGASGIHIFNVDFSWCAQYLLTFQHVLPQPSCHFVRVRSLLLSLGANFDIARGTRATAWCSFQLILKDSGKEILWVLCEVLL